MIVAWAVVGFAIGSPRIIGALLVGAWLVTGLVLLGLALLARSGRDPTTRRGGIALLTLALSCCATAVVLTAASTGADSRRPQILLEASRGGRFVVAVATTTQTVLAGSPSFTATVNEVQIGSVKHQVTVPVRVFRPVRDTGAANTSPVGTAVGQGDAVGIGAELAIVGRVKSTAPGDSSAFLFFSSGVPELIRPPPFWLDWANQLRSSFRMTAQTLPGEGGNLLPGLAIGDTSAVTVTLDSAMRASSLSHLTAVSGANCAVVIGLVMVGCAVAGLRRGARVAASITVLVGFVVLVTPEPSVLRAAVMATLVLLCLSSGRPTQGVPVLSLAIFILVVGDPWLSREYGFVLSVLATAGLLILSGPLAVALTRWFPRPIAVLLSIPLAAQLACQPVIILLNPTIPTYGLLANILAAPAAPIATVLGLGSCVVLPWWPWLGGALANLAWIPSAWIAAVAMLVSQLPGGQLPWVAGIGGSALLAVVTVLMLILVLAPKLGLRWRKTISISLAVLFVGHGGIIAGGALHTQFTRPSNWQFALCDIGQGDAVLVRSAGKIALIDTGPRPERLTSCLETLGVTQIDLLILTHYDLDHVGGVAAVLGRVGEAIIGPSSGADDNRISSRVRTGGTPLRLGVPGLTGVLGELRWRILWPPSPLRGVEPGNPASVVVALEGAGECRSGCLSAMFLGDLGEESQSRLLTLDLGSVDVVKVAHHGSADQSARLYARLNARVGLIGVGADNRYGHPNPKLLRLLAASATIAARTDQDGLVLIAPSEDAGITIWRERRDSAATGKP